MSEKEILYSNLLDLRKQVMENKKAMKYYEHLKNINCGDALYGWEFENDAILKDTLDDLDMYQDSYVIAILTIYYQELETILYKVNLV